MEGAYGKSPSAPRGLQQRLRYLFRRRLEPCCSLSRPRLPTRSTTDKNLRSELQVSWAVVFKQLQERARLAEVFVGLGCFVNTTLTGDQELVKRETRGLRNVRKQSTAMNDPDGYRLLDQVHPVSSPCPGFGTT